MSSTTSSDRLTLLSYATFNHHIPIYDHSGSTWRQHQRKQAETMIALAISLTEWQVCAANASIFDDGFCPVRSFYLV